MDRSAERLIEVFNAAKARPAGAERESFLAEACGDDADLKKQVASLLEADGRAGDFLHKTSLMPLAEKPGDRIGHYKLLQQLGEGGCGVVYMAEQQEPVRRRVALKVIKLGMDTKSVIARFEAERQALALMDHPNIAKVFDAGATETGRPFFVMELVRGIKITDYCDQNNLTTEQRLELFTQVCHAVQHAHQKGIIHRDLKPSNILVTLHDGVPVPKVIDFGVAKATSDQRLTDKTIFTAFEQFIGTPAYMSPEQAEMSGLDIDTRSDIYSLGVLLYELLTGRTPLDPEELLRSGMNEMRRKIREDEPPRPSTRLSTMQAADLTTIAKHRQADAPKLIHLVHGDLDWIVMKCLEKDRTRRYETVSALGSDIQRHLQSEPVQARPPSVGYRFRKFVSRHKTTCALASVSAVAVIAFAMVGLFAYRNHLTQEARRADQRVYEQQRRNDRRQNAIEKAMLAASSGELESSENSIREAELAGASLGEVRMLRGQVAFHRGDYIQATEHLEQAVKLSPGSVAAQSMLAMAYINVGRWEKVYPIINAIEQVLPNSAEDYLFLAQLQSYFDPERALSTLSQAPRQHASAMTRLIRGGVRMTYATITGTTSDAEAALADANVAREMVPDNPFVIALNLYGQLICAGAYADTGQLEKRGAALRQAAADAAALAEYRGNHIAVRARTAYFKYADEDQAALGILRQAAAELRDLRLDYEYALMLYRNGQFQEALNALEREKSGGGSAPNFIRGYILAELPEGPELARTHFHQLWRQNPSFDAPLYFQTTLRLLGRKAEAVEACLKLREQAPALPPWKNEWYHRLLDYNCDRISAGDLLKAAGASRWNQSEAHFFIAITRLAEGDRAGAREHFRQAVGKRMIGFFHYDWSAAFLLRLEKDPNWPPWIP